MLEERTFTLDQETVLVDQATWINSIVEQVLNTWYLMDEIKFHINQCYSCNAIHFTSWAEEAEEKVEELWIKFKNKLDEIQKLCVAAKEDKSGLSLKFINGSDVQKMLDKEQIRYGYHYSMSQVFITVKFEYLSDFLESQGYELDDYLTPFKADD